MPTYLQLGSEAVWGAQRTPANMTAYLLDPLRAHYGMGPASIGAAGDNNHLYGRHRSRNWCLTSKYCTDRSYGTRDPRDQRGDGNLYRGFDVGIQGEELQAASRRMDALARSGRCAGLAEWFGTFDGENVVGWYEGHPSSSDDSHLWHLHGGVWTEFADDAATMQLLYATITGEDDMDEAEHNILVATDQRLWQSVILGNPSYVDSPGTGAEQTVWLVGAINDLAAAVERIESKLAAGGGPGGLTYEQAVQAAEEGANKAEDS